MPRIVLVVLFASLSLYAGFVEVEDRAKIPLLNEDFKDQKREKIRLTNGLEVLLVSDPKADQSAAALVVGAGSWDDPKEYPGMAHLCEHMLFGGSKKFPGENEFNVLVTDHKGMTNAYTLPDRTAYLFSSNHQAFPMILERFSRFFIDPLFDSSFLERELKAVDQEFAKEYQNDGRRLMMVLKETANPEHPHAQFSAGNSKTLAKIPRQALQEWFERNYGAERMKLVLYSSLPPEAMREMADQFFSEVPPREWPPLGWKPITSAEQKGHLIAVASIKESQSLLLSWELPQDLSDDSKPAHLLAYALNRGQENNLYDLLKKEGFVNSLGASVEEVGGHSFFRIVMDLTTMGIDDVDVVVLRCFQALAAFKGRGISPEFHAEKNEANRLAYQYQERGSAFDEVSSFVSDLLDEPLETYPSKSLFAERYDASKLAELFLFLTPENCSLCLLANPEKMNLDLERRERWMGVEYTVQPLTGMALQRLQEVEPHPGIALPEVNPFWPKSFSLVERQGALPQKIAEEEGGAAYYYPCAEFPVPEISFFVRIRTPALSHDPKQRLLASFYALAFEEQFKITALSAKAANLHSSLLMQNEIFLEFQGFSDQAARYVSSYLRRLAELKQPSSEQFERYRESLERSLQRLMRPQAGTKARSLFASILFPEEPSEEVLLKTLPKITEEDFTDFSKKLFESTHIEAFFSGNLTRDEADHFWQELKSSLQKTPYLHPPERKQMPFPADGPFVIRNEMAQALGNATFLVLDQGSFSMKRRAAQQILADILQPSFFDELRTKQKTGYIVYSYCTEEDFNLTQGFLVQSNTHDPEELLYRFELFLEMQLQNLKELVPPARFEALKKNLLEVLRTGPRSQKEQGALYNLLAFKKEANFDWVAQRIEGIEALTYEDFLAEAETFFSRANRKRIAILVRGATTEAHAGYEPITLDELKVRGVASHTLQQRARVHLITHK